MNEKDPIMTTDNEHRHERVSTTTLNVILLGRLMSYSHCVSQAMWRHMDRVVTMAQYSMKFKVPSLSASRVFIMQSSISFCMRHKHNNMHTL